MVDIMLLKPVNHVRLKRWLYPVLLCSTVILFWYLYRGPGKEGILQKFNLQSVQNAGTSGFKSLFPTSNKNPEVKESVIEGWKKKMKKPKNKKKGKSKKKNKKKSKGKKHKIVKREHVSKEKDVVNKVNTNIKIKEPPKNDKEKIVKNKDDKYDEEHPDVSESKEGNHNDHHDDDELENKDDHPDVDEDEDMLDTGRKLEAVDSNDYEDMELSTVLPSEENTDREDDETKIKWKHEKNGKKTKGTDIRLNY